ncbi:MAG: HAMP domain-containing protein [Burkholderiales bacterium]|nr:HAMP domain-containing protein [Burkholderiales bacterium]
MRLLPRSLFGRLVLLLVSVVALAVLLSIVLFRLERANLLNRQLSETKLAQVQAIRSALEATDDPQGRGALAQMSREYGVRIFPESERPMRGQPPGGPLMKELAERWRERLGPETDIRFAPRQQMLFVRVVAAGTPYWIGVTVPPRPPADELPTRAIAWTVAMLISLLLAAFVFARYLARPLRELTAAVESLGRGESARALPESGPSEIAALNRGFNAMTANLRQIEQDRALLLAGVSHDLRTPLARLRLGLELGARDEQLRAGMESDIEEMDRIIGQFLDFARSDLSAVLEAGDLDAIVGTSVDRYVRAGHPVTFIGAGVPPLPLKATAISRLTANLIDNALAYGKPPVEVVTSVRGAKATIEVADRGNGIAADQVERLKLPFTRATESRARADGRAGAGLGLAIVDRIARMHGGRFDLLPREGGGMVARVELPLLAR